MKNNALFLFMTICILAVGCKSPLHIDLSGEWTYKLDRKDVGKQEQWHKLSFTETLQLPGSLATNNIGDKPDTSTIWTGNNWGDIKTLPFFTDDAFEKYRDPDNFKFPYWLQPKYKYYGASWYQKEIEIPEIWNDKRIILNLERCHWESEVWVNDTYLGIQNSLATAHSYNLSGAIKTGKNKITIKIDNRIKNINPGANAHSISDHTQSNWNGIVGDISIRAQSKVFINEVILVPDIHNKTVQATVRISDDGQSQNRKVKLNLRAHHKKTGKRLGSITREVEFRRQATVTLNYPMGKEILLWDEFTPNLYTMEISIEGDDNFVQVEENFGMIETKVIDKTIYINDRASFFRGTLECAIFPKTGFPPTDTKEWLRIFNTVKSFGLNHVRFHSWCPPKAAFDAADQLGIYLQVEANTWATIGKDEPIDQWIYSETKAILKAYGNHPSFVIMAYGNEPGGDHESYLEKYIEYWKPKNKRLIFAPGAGWPYLDNADVSLPSKPRLQRWAEGNKSIINAQAPQTEFDYTDIVKNYPGAVISHEIGQWCVYPDFSEIEKYDGVLEAKNFEIFQETLNERGLGHLADSFLLASGKLQTLCYKTDIEALLRTPGSSGFQLLDLHDFPGQGTALVGVLNAFWEEKGYVTAQEYRQFCNTVVPLARFPKRTYTDQEKIKVDIELANYSADVIKEAKPHWFISNEKGEVIKKGILKSQDLPIGNTISLGHIAERMPAGALGKFTLNVSLEEFNNAWEFWVYPAQNKKLNDKQILITQELNNEIIEKLQNGAKVLLSLPQGSIKSSYGGDIAVGFSSIFWNTAWTKGQAPHTLGILCDPKHKALAFFPTEFHSDWQWWDAMSHADAIDLSQLSKQKIKPIVRIIDDWVTNRDLALIFEVRVGKGDLIVTGTDLFQNQKDRLEARQLLYSLKSYMLSPDFKPEVTLKAEELAAMMK